MLIKSSEQRSGASQSKTQLTDRFRSYLNHHKVVASESLLRLLRTPLQSMLTWLVVAIAIALPSILYLGISQFQVLGSNWEFDPQLSVYLSPRAREEAVLGLRKRLLTKPEIATVDYVSPQQAMDEFEQSSGLGNVLQSLDENPLPAVLVVYPGTDYRDSESLLLLQQAIQSEPVVDEAQLDIAWVQRLQQIAIIAERVVLALASLLALGVLLVIGNTIRLAIESRRDEIIVVKLVGGADAFVRRPFLYTGFWYGIGGGLLAWLILVVGISWLSVPVAQLADLYESDIKLRGLGWQGSMLIFAGSALLGLLGAFLAVSRHLREIEPK